MLLPAQQPRGNDAISDHTWAALQGMCVPRFLVLLFACALLAGARSSQAQVLYGTLVGSVTDSSELAVVGATVVATDTGTNIAKTATTDNSGNYRLTNLVPGTYSVSVAAKTFGSVVSQEITIRANIELRFDVQLHPKSVGETVTVTGAPPELQTDNATVTNELETAQVQTLVTTAGFNMRNFQSLFLVLPGFSPPGEQHSESSNPADTMMFNANGVSGSNNSTRIDGVSDIYAWLPEITAYTPSTEAIASVNVVTNSFNAEQGFASGAAVNVTTKSGTNQFHGTAWEYNMISALMAKPFFTPSTSAIPKYVLNQFGANYGGPIKKNKAFFFGNWERTRRVQELSGNQTVPTTPMLTGDFSAISTTIYNPATGNADGTGRTPFLNNTIPSGSISYAANQMVKLLESSKIAPNVAGAGLSNNWYGVASGQYTRDNVDTRIDYNPSSRSTIFGRYGFQKSTIFDPQTLGAAGGNTFDSGQPGNAPGLVQSIGIGGTYAFRSNLLLDANVGYLRQGMSAKNTDIGTDWGTSYFNIPGTNGTCSLCGGMPGFFFNSSNFLSQLGNENRSNPFQFRDNTYVSAANLSWNIGKHSTRYGMEFDRFAINHFQPQNTYGPRGGFLFSGGLTALNGGVAVNGYNTWADFLLGLPQEVQKDTQYLNPATSRESIWAFYAQDQWQATSKLTVNFGVRYEYYPIATRDHTGLDIFNPADGNIYVEGSGGVPSSVKVKVGKGMVVPRIGLAYRVDSKTVVRAGFGLSTNPDSYRNVLTTYPSVVSQTILGNTSYVSPIVNGATVTLTTGIPTLTAPTLSASSPSVALATLGSPLGSLGASTLPLNYRRGYYESYNAAFERQLPGAVTLNATYVGELIIREVPGLNINANQAPGQTAAQVPFGKSGGNSVYASTASAPNGITASITSYIPNGTGHYNALQAQAKRRFAGDSSVGVNYTYSRAINDYGDQSGGESSLLVAMTSQPYWHLNKAVAGFDRTHNLQAFGNYALPFGKGQAYFPTGAAGYILGGWGLSGALSRESGAPFTVQGSSASLGPSTSGSTQFADVLSKSSMVLGGHDSKHPYLNPAAFADPSVAEKAASGSSCSSANTTVCRFGTAGRNSVRGPGLFNLSTSVARTFAITERYGFVFRAEAFNLTNTPQFSNPSGNGIQANASSGFGYISAVTTNSNRELRFSGRVTF
jgi:hypothetical protein